MAACIQRRVSEANNLILGKTDRDGSGSSYYKTAEMEEMDEKFGDIWYQITGKRVKL
jgi:hypothetical protein